MKSKNSPATNSRNSKRKCTDLSTDDSDDDFRNTATTWPRFICIETSDSEKPISKLSPFAISKAIQGLIGDPESVKRIRPEVLLVECKKKSQSDSLLKIKQLVDRSVEVKPHQSLNSSKGIIRTRELQHETTENIKKNFHSQGVTDVYRISVMKNGQRQATNTFILTFNSPRPPKHILAGYWSFDVEVYIPNPLRCFNCQRFGHHRSNCKRTVVCAVCSEAHDGKDCTKDPKCFNCGDSHPSFSRSCPVWQKEKEIQKVKIENNISFPEARERVQSTFTIPSQSYASAVKGPVKQSKTIETQTVITWPYNAPNYKTIVVPDHHRPSVDTQTNSTALSEPTPNTSQKSPEKTKASSQTTSCRDVRQPGGSDDPVRLSNKFDTLMETETEETSSPPPNPKPVKPKPPIKPILPPS